MADTPAYITYACAHTNVLIRELIDARKRGVKVEVILEMKEGLGSGLNIDIQGQNKGLASRWRGLENISIALSG